ncbi:MAG: dialkylresorcinol condensing enzyme DarA [Chitinophagales bacterium]|nr:hypothetical protein [Chitinophagaceae bacterium]MCB9064363.1 dialkylresorcinol condensing enzyme DarA [Chitinophagales bacterium]
MKKKILVLYYTQSGQLRNILDSVVSDIKDETDIDFAEIKPEQPFSFPWKASSFFDAMPESVLMVPSPIQPLPEEVISKDYDLVILGYQPWFLSPSQPTSSFLQSEYATLLNGKPVVTVVGCRNMWLNGQERVKELLQKNNAKLVGNIVLVDTHPNLISLLTVIRWAFKGQKEPSRFLPAAGVQDEDINNASRFGKTIFNSLANNTLPRLQEALLQDRAISLKPGLVVLEKRGITNFRKFAPYIRKKGGPGDPNRKGRVDLFKSLLLTGIFILSPISTLTAKLQQQLQRKQLKKAVDYFRGVTFEEGRL